MLIAQITDCHIVEPGALLQDRVDTAAMLRSAIAHIESLDPTPDVVLATGDLVNDGTPQQYANLVAILDSLSMPVIAIPGNHDDRANMAAAFGLAPIDADQRMDLVVDGLPVRLIGLDTTIPGEHGGSTSPDQMRWLDEQLAAAPHSPTLIFQHHPPFATGIAWMDDVGLAGSELEADVVARHPQVQAIVCGHVHRSVHTTVGGVRASTWPSTGAQVALALDGTRYGYVDEPAAIALHHWSEGQGLVSHLSLVGSPAPWLPGWATEAD
jgi:3',5'-cyclic AMP phosphodiesterase CpdA